MGERAKQERKSYHLNANNPEKKRKKRAYVPVHQLSALNQEKQRIYWKNNNIKKRGMKMVAAHCKAWIELAELHHALGTAQSNREVAPDCSSRDDLLVLQNTLDSLSDTVYLLQHLVNCHMVEESHEVYGVNKSQESDGNDSDSILCWDNLGDHKDKDDDPILAKVCQESSSTQNGMSSHSAIELAGDDDDDPIADQQFLESMLKEQVDRYPIIIQQQEARQDFDIMIHATKRVDVIAQPPNDPQVAECWASSVPDAVVPANYKPFQLVSFRSLDEKNPATYSRVTSTTMY